LLNKNLTPEVKALFSEAKSNIKVVKPSELKK